jgi:hypothetical protein
MGRNQIKVSNIDTFRIKKQACIGILMGFDGVCAHSQHRKFIWSHMKNTAASISAASLRPPAGQTYRRATGAASRAPGALALSPLSRVESALLLAVAIALLVACFGPAVAQHAHYHAFADQRAGWGVPFAMDVLSNLPFAVAGVWGLVVLRRFQPGAQPALAALFFAGLLVTAACSSFYHWQPDNAGLAIDRLGMVVAFAGLLGLAVADRISNRAGVATAATVLALGPLSVMVWATSGNLLPWAVLQGGGMLLIVLLAVCRTTGKPIAGAWGIPLATVIALYALAKVLELGDYPVFEFTHGLVSGHSLKHAVAALAAWPVIGVMHNHATNRHARIQSQLQDSASTAR